MREYNFSTVIKTMLKERTAKTAEEAIGHINAWLQWMALLPHIPKESKIVMFSPEMDSAFHAAIINTRFYAGFCDTFFGIYIHHDPLDTDVTPVSELEDAIEFTMALFPEVYDRELSENGLKYVLYHADKGITPQNIPCIGWRCYDL